MKNLDSMKAALEALATDQPLIANVDAEAIIRLEGPNQRVVISDCNLRYPAKAKLYKPWLLPAFTAAGVVLGALLGRRRP